MTGRPSSIHPHREPRPRHVGLGLGDGVLAEVKDRGGEHGAGVAVAHALDHEPDFPAQLAASLQTRRDLLVAGLADAGLTARVPEGTYFATTDISHLGWADGREFCLALPDVAGVVAIPNVAFYDDREEGQHLVRWAFCKQPDVIAEGVRRLAAADLAR